MLSQSELDLRYILSEPLDIVEYSYANQKFFAKIMEVGKTISAKNYAWRSSLQR